MSSDDFFSFTPKELLRGKVITPAWYRVRIEQIGKKLSKDGNSTNFNVEGTILFNSEDGTTDFANYPLEWNFNSKAMGFARGFLEAQGIQVDSDTRYSLTDGRFDGSEVDVYVDNKLYEGRTVNQVGHKYRSPRQ
jgi:hypothetical protein